MAGNHLPHYQVKYTSIVLEIRQSLINFNIPHAILAISVLRHTIIKPYRDLGEFMK